MAASRTDCPDRGPCRGFVSGRRDVIAVEVFADTAVSVMFNKVLMQVYDQLPEKQAWSPATLVLEDGQFSELTYTLDDVFGALEDAGVDFAAVKGGKQALDLMRHATQRTKYDQFGVRVGIEAPPADELMDASDMTLERPADPDLCEAAR